MTTLALSLPYPRLPDLHTEYGFATSADGHTVLQHGSTTAALLPKPAHSTDTAVLVVPPQALSWFTVTLPRAALGARLRPVLEGLLEDRLLDEPAHLHFALQPRPQASVPVHVAVCNHLWLQSHLQALQTAGLRAGRIVPEFAPSDDDSSALHVLANQDGPDNAILVHAQSGKDVFCTPLAAAALLGAHGVALDQTQRFAEPSVAAQAEASLGATFTLQTPPQRWLQATHTHWNLAQFDLSTSNGQRMRERMFEAFRQFTRTPPWRAARWALAGLVVMQLLGLNAYAWRETRALNATQAQAHHVLNQTFPHVRVIVDAPVQMQREVALLRQATGAPSHSDFTTMMGVLASALPTGKQLQKINFAQGQAQLEGLDLSEAEMQAAIARLHAQGYSLFPSGQALLLRYGDAP